MWLMQNDRNLMCFHLRLHSFRKNMSWKHVLEFYFAESVRTYGEMISSNLGLVPVALQHHLEWSPASTKT